MKQKTIGRNVTKDIGAGLAIAGAAALGYYFYGSDTAKQHRKVAMKWARDMKIAVIREAKLLKKVTPGALAMIVDKTARVYHDVEPSELKRAARELKENWEMIERETRAATKKTARKAVKKAKKTVKKMGAK